MTLHPNIMSTFSIVVVDFLYLKPALPFGPNFSPQNWEPVRLVIEVLAKKLFLDKSLTTKYRKYLGNLQLEKITVQKKAKFVRSKVCFT